MKIKKINETDYTIYLFKDKVSELNLFDEIKVLIISVQKLLKLKGFYKVIVSIKKIGCFLRIVKIEDSLYKNTLDLKIEKSTENIYFKTNDYFLIKDSSLIRYKDKFFYAQVDDYFDKILEKVEFGEFVFEKDIGDCWVI